MKAIEYSSYIVTLLLIGIVVVYWIKHRIRPWAIMGFVIDNHTIQDILAGIAICGVSVSLIFLIDNVFNLIKVKEIVSPSDIFYKFILFIFIASFIEEFINRSLLVNGLLVLIKRKWLIIVLASIFFGLGHATGEGVSAVSILSNALGGAIYTTAFLGAKNLWFPWALHFSWNTFQYLYGYPVSGLIEDPIVLQGEVRDTIFTGGIYGPEGGIVGLIFRFVILLVLLFYLSKSRRVRIKEIIS